MNQIYRSKEQKIKERPLIFAYSFLAVMAGIFLTTFDILVHARFLEVFGYKYLASSYVASGIAGTFFTYLYSLFFRRLHTKTLNLIVATLVAVLACTYLVLGFFIAHRIVSYYGMVLLFPINTMIVLILWRFGRKMLKPRQSREILPLLRKVHLFGIAIGGLSVTVGLYFFSLSIASWISLLALTFYYITHFLLYRIHKRSRLFHSGKEKYIPVTNNLLLFFTSPIATNLLIFTLLSAIVGFSIHFTFINIAAAGFQNMIGMSKFYGLFIATMSVFIFGMDKFLIKKILYANDSPYSLVLIPFILLLAVSITIGGYHFFAGTKPHEHFTLYFLLLAISKVGYDSIKTIVQTPSLRSLFQILDIRYQQVVYPRIEGTIVMIGLTISGVVILGITFLPFFNLNVVMYWTALISVIWIWWAIRLIKSYAKAQDVALKKLRFSKDKLISESFYEEKLWKTFVGRDTIKIRFLLRTLAKIHPATYEKYLMSLLAQPYPEVKKLVLEEIVSQRMNTALPELIKKAEQATGNENDLLMMAINGLRNDLVIHKSPEELRELVYSGDMDERIWLASTLGYALPDQAESVLYELTKDASAEVQNTALRSLARIKNIEFNYSLLDFLYPGSYNPYALDVISNAGNKTLDHLERELMLTETPDIVKARIVKLYGRMGTSQSIEKIVGNLLNQDNFVLMQSIQSLIDSHFQVSASQKYKLVSFIVKQIGIIAENLHFYHKLVAMPKAQTLADAYGYEINKNYDLVFKLLALTYNPQIIQSIKTLCLEGSRSQINHGLELADQYLDEELKPLLFPLLEDISTKEKLKKLEYFFVQTQAKIMDILRITLTHDFNSISFYSRISAIDYILKNKITEFEEELIFNAYHSELLISETAINALQRLHPQSLEGVTTSSERKTILLNVIEAHEKKDPNLLFSQRFTALKQFDISGRITEYVILQLASNAELIHFSESAPLRLSEKINTYSLILTDTETLNTNNYVISGYQGIINLKLLEEYGIEEIYPDKEATAWLFSGEVVDELLYDHVDFANEFFNSTDTITLSK